MKKGMTTGSGNAKAWRHPSSSGNVGPLAPTKIPGRSKAVVEPSE